MTTTPLHCPSCDAETYPTHSEKAEGWTDCNNCGHRFEIPPEIPDRTSTVIKKEFACLRIDLKTARSVLAKGDTLETAFAHYGSRNMPCLSLETGAGEVLVFRKNELDLPTTDAEREAAAFACLATTLRPVLALSGSMDDQARALIGRHLMRRLVRATDVRTIRDLRVGELIDAINDAEAPCHIV